MSRSVTTIVGLGIITALFLAVMSMFYLQQIPTKADLERLSEDLRVEHGLYLSSSAPLDVELIQPTEDGGRFGAEVRCLLRADIRKHPRTVELYLARMAESVLAHPDWRGKIGFATVVHATTPETTVTRFAAAEKDGKP